MAADRKASPPTARSAEAVRPATAPFALLKAVIDCQPDAIALLDRSLRFIAVNAAWASTMGISETEAVGRTPGELFGELGAPVEEELGKALAGRELIRTFETPHDGKLRQAILAPWRDEAGEICGVMTRNGVQDSVEQQAVRRERRLAMAMKMAKIYSFEVDFRTGEITFEPAGPEGAEKSRFYCYEDMLAPLPEAERPARRELWEKHLVTGELMIQEYSRMTPDGGVRWQMTASEAVRNMDNQVVGVAGMTQLIDDRKRVELALVAEKEAAQAADRAKSEFLANISHEIRTPLNGVLGLSSLLAQADLNPAQSEMVRTIEMSAQTLNALLSDVLDLAKIESGRLELDPHPFDPVELVGHVHKLFAGAAAEKKLSFTCEIDPSLHGLVVSDRTRLSQILTNLTSNAIKFTASGGVTIRAWADDDRRRLSFTVSDSGVGISQDVLGRLFERFVQADGSINRSFGGTGLGLAISRTLARMMGGDVDVISEPGKGSTFTLTIDAARWSEDPGERVADGATAAPSLPRDRLVRVLLVEDHPVNRRVVELILGDMVSLDCRENGAEGLAAFKLNPYDVVLMDMQMPVMDGLEATREIRAFERAVARPATPIVMLSANALSEHIRSGLEAGADFHLAKPITANELVRAVARAVEASTRTAASAQEDAVA
jgi:PAS domain S-box-containing protein